MYVINKGTKYTLKYLAEKHWKNLNPKSGRSYEPDSLIKKLEAIINDKNTSASELIFFKELSKNHYKLLKEIITGTPSVLEQIRSDLNTIILNNNLFYYSKNNRRNVATNFCKNILKLFDYKTFRGTSECSWLITNLGVYICPYCNIIPLEILKSGKKTELFLEIDHFYSQKKTPFLALSFYNLLPACERCNKRCKKEMQFDILNNHHPFISNIDGQFKFGFKKEPLHENDSKFIIEPQYTQTNYSTTESHLGIFKVLKRIKTPNTKVQILNLTYIAHEYRNNYSLTLHQSLPELTNNKLKKTMLKLANVPNSKEEAAKKPLGKLLYDIADFYKLLN